MSRNSGEVSIIYDKVGINENFQRDNGASTTLAVAASVGDTSIEVADATGLTVGNTIRIYNATTTERTHIHITIVAAAVLTLDRPLDNAYSIGDSVVETEIDLSQDGSLAAPLSFKITPPSNEVWHILRILPTMTDATAMGDATFGGMTALTNGVVIREYRGGVFRTLTHWGSNSHLKEDMYDVTYSLKPPAGAYGLSGRWSFYKASFVVKLDGAAGDYLEILVQDSLSALDTFTVKAQGHIVD